MLLLCHSCMARYSDLRGVLNNQFMCKHKNGEQYPDFGATAKTDIICWSFLAGQGCGAMKVRSCLMYITNFSIKSLSLPSNFRTHGYEGNWRTTWEIINTGRVTEVHPLLVE